MSVSPVLFSSATDMWATPQGLFEELNKEFGFTLDVCAVKENAKCEAYYTPKDDGLSKEWTGVCWCNPPYGKTVGEWVRKAHESSKDGAKIVMLLPARTDTKWFHQYIYKKAEVRFIKGRLKFGNSKNSAPFPSMIVVFGGCQVMDGAEAIRNLEIMATNLTGEYSCEQSDKRAENIKKKIDAIDFAISLLNEKWLGGAN